MTHLFLTLIFCWPYIWDSGANEFANSIDVDAEGMIICGAWVWDTLSSKGIVFKIDPSANFLWEVELLPQDAMTSCVKKIKTSGTNIFITGYITVSPFKDVGTIWKLDANGNLIFERRWDNYENSYINSIDMDSYGNLYVVGTIYSGERYMTRIVKYDSLFNTIWEIFDSSYINTYGNDIKVGNNSLYITGEAWNNITSKWVWFLSRYDLNGNLLWNTLISGNPAEDNHGLCVAVDSEENVYTGGYFWQPPGYNWWIEKRNSSGNQLWGYSVGLSGVHDILFDIEISQNYLLLAGYKDIPPTWRWAIEKRDIGTGSLICSHTVSYPGEDRFGQALGIKGLPNGYIYVIGHRHYLPGETWDVRVALYDPNCNMVLVREKENKKGKISYLLINPFKNYAVIISSSKSPFTLYSSEGKRIGKILPGKVFGEELKPGIYYLKRGDEKIKFVKIGGEK